MKTYYIDAEGKILGRLASRIAVILIGKNKVGYVPYLDKGDAVVVKNADKIKVTGKKMKDKKYYHYSGYPGGMKERTLEEQFKKSPTEVLRKAVYNMLPKNKLRKSMMSRLHFE